MVSARPKTVGLGLLFGAFVGFKSKFNFTRGGTNPIRSGTNPIRDDTKYTRCGTNPIRGGTKSTRVVSNSHGVALISHGVALKAFERLHNVLTVLAAGCAPVATRDNEPLLLKRADIERTLKLIGSVPKTDM